MSSPAPDVKLLAPEEPALAPHAPPAEHQPLPATTSDSEARHEAEQPEPATATEVTPDAAFAVTDSAPEPQPAHPSEARREAEEPEPEPTTETSMTPGASHEEQQPELEPAQSPSAAHLGVGAASTLAAEAAPHHAHEFTELEKRFQEVEEERERRAHEEEARSRPSTANGNANSTGSSPSLSALAVARERDRRRGSISVSRFGQATDLATGTHDHPSTLPSRQNSLIIKAGKTGAFYQAQKFAGSADSFASDTHAAPPHEDVHDEEQVTQMETIAGRVSLGKAVGRTIARRLSRARSRELLAVSSSALVIGVSVEEATVEAEHHDDEKDGSSGSGNGEVPRSPHGTVFAFAHAEVARGTRSRRSTVSMPNPPAAQPAAPAAATGTMTPGTDKRSSTAISNWMKQLTNKLRRRSRDAIPTNSSP